MTRFSETSQGLQLLDAYRSAAKCLPAGQVSPMDNPLLPEHQRAPEPGHPRARDHGEDDAAITNWT